MTPEQRKRAIRRRRRRQQRIKRRLFCVGAAAVLISIIAVAISFAAGRGQKGEAKETTETRLETETEQITTEVLETEPEKEKSLIISMDWGADEAYILTKMAMAEAEGEDTEGKALVILVILNRVWAEQFPDTIQGVISQQNAFTSYSNGRYDRVEPNADCWAALRLVESKWNESQDALYFERTPAAGEITWHSQNLKKLFTHGNHTFYREKDKDGN